MLSKFSMNQSVNVLYPVNGRRNILRSISGDIVATGNGPGGKYITVNTHKGYRTLSTKKIVSL
jgi:hypothetical protein